MARYSWVMALCIWWAASALRTVREFKDNNGAAKPAKKSRKLAKKSRKLAKKRGKAKAKQPSRTGGSNNCNGKKKMKKKVVNGEAAKKCSVPWQVAMVEREGEHRPFCGGTLISEEWVLSAAHCQCEAPIPWVGLGLHDLGNPSPDQEQFIEVEKEVIHPGYSCNGNDNDVMLLKLSKKANLTDCVGTASLPTSDVKDGTECHISGWGHTSFGGQGATVLQEAEVSIVESCGKYEKNRITENMVCAQGGKGGKVVDGCQGDSGGPLICKDGGKPVVHGATSWGDGCAEKDFPGVWARITKFKGWIEKEMASGGSGGGKEKASGYEDRYNSDRRRRKDYDKSFYDYDRYNSDRRRRKDYDKDNKHRRRGR